MIVVCFVLFWLKLFLLKFLLEALTKEKGSTGQGLQILLVSDNHFFQSGPFTPLDAQPLLAKQVGYFLNKMNVKNTVIIIVFNDIQCIRWG